MCYLDEYVPMVCPGSGGELGLVDKDGLVLQLGPVVHQHVVDLLVPGVQLRPRHNTLRRHSLHLCR